MTLLQNILAAIIAGGLFVPGAFAQDPPKPPTAPRARAAARVVTQGSGASFLGVGVVEIDAERAKALGLKEEYGVEVKNVDGDSPAAKAGLKEGDVVLEYSGQRVQGVEQFIRLVRETPVGRQVKLLISRNGASQTVTATTAARKGTFFSSGPGFEINIPNVMEFHMPDLPRSLMSWQSHTLGIESESVGSQLAEYFGVKSGVLVRSVTKGSAAEKAGIKAGDVIVKVDSQQVASPKEISSALRSLKSKKTFPLSIVRNRNEMTVNVTIEENSSSDTGSRRPPFVMRIDGSRLKL